DREAFSRLNLAWIEKLFEVEEDDRLVLGDPEKSILADGGHILVARQNGQPVGVCALLHVDDTAYELAKMAVDARLRGHGIGRKLLAATIDHARRLGAEVVLIGTNSKLEDAIHLYRDIGFVPSTDRRLHQLERINVRLELRLKVSR